VRLRLGLSFLCFQLKERQREQEQTLGLDAGELPPGFRVLDTYASNAFAP
jgi:hypothetical protein